MYYTQTQIKLLKRLRDLSVGLMKGTNEFWHTVPKIVVLMSVAFTLHWSIQGVMNLSLLHMVLDLIILNLLCIFICFLRSICLTSSSLSLSTYRIFIFFFFGIRKIIYTHIHIANWPAQSCVRDILSWCTFRLVIIIINNKKV